MLLRKPPFSRSFFSGGFFPSGLGEALAELSQATVRTLQELNESLGETQAAIEKLRRDIESGAVSVKPVFPVVSADPASPKEGEAWVLGGRPNR